MIFIVITFVLAAISFFAISNLVGFVFCAVGLLELVIFELGNKLLDKLEKLKANDVGPEKSAKLKKDEREEEAKPLNLKQLSKAPDAQENGDLSNEDSEILRLYGKAALERIRRARK